jgi:hypothetical protein
VADEPERLIMIWTVLADEAGTHGPSPLIAMGGFLSTAEQWEKFDCAWADHLSRFNLPYSHGHELVQRHEGKHNEFVLSAHGLINQYLGAGFVAVLRKGDYKKYYRSGQKPKKLPQDTQYGVLFRALVSISLGLIVYEKGDDAAKEDVINFVLENGAKSGDAQRLYGLFKKDRRADPIMKQMLDPVLDFAEKEDSPGCQVADLMLYAAYRQELTEHGEAPSIIEESSFASADAPIRPNEIPTFRIPIGQEVLESLKEGLLMEEKARRQYAKQLLKNSRLRRD